MRPGHFHIALVHPEIPQNTGTTGRLAASAQVRLHLVRPFGFSTDDKNLKRAGLDYWPYLDLEIHQSLEQFLDQFKNKKIALIESRVGAKSYTELPTDTDLVLFGSETKGLPNGLVQKYFENCYEIPMFHPKMRSINLANAVSIVTYALLEKKGLLKP